MQVEAWQWKLASSTYYIRSITVTIFKIIRLFSVLIMKASKYLSHKTLKTWFRIRLNKGCEIALAPTEYQKNNKTDNVG